MSIAAIVQIIFLSLSILYITRTYRCFIHNLDAARTSNIPYIVVPVWWLNPFWRAIQSFWAPILRRLPIQWTDPWLEVILENWTWRDRFALLEKLGTDTFLTVSPGGNTLYVANASVINEITSRRNDFPKPIQDYKILEIYGKSLISLEGSLWKYHRKIASPLFTEKSNHTVWVETLLQAQAMLKSWFKDDKDKSSTINTVEEDTMRISLHVISRVVFGVHLQWPGVKMGEDASLSEQNHQDPKSGQKHVMTYADAINTVLRNIFLILLIPRFLLSQALNTKEAITLAKQITGYLPFTTTKAAYTAFIEWGRYMNEMFESSKKKLSSGEVEEGTNFMASLVKAAGAVPDRSDTSPSPDKEPVIQKQTLTDSEILGNTFLFILAGHETTANSLLFSLIYLALNTASQRHLQSDLDQVFQGREIDQWNYNGDIPKLYNSMAEAVLNEQLRLIPPVAIIPKCTLDSQPDQSITINGNKCIVPAGTFINILSVAVHRNPRFWPAGPPSDPHHPAHPLSNTKNDLEEFKPERWLNNTHSSNFIKSASPSQIGSSPKDESTILYKPQKGAFVPFSEGPRSCIGRRFAQVEILTVLAVIFSQYSAELAVDKFASDKDLEVMTADEKKEVWTKAKEEIEKAMREQIVSLLSLKFRGAKVPLRFVKRGKETFG